jgi:hypothetical protein
MPFAPAKAGAQLARGSALKTNDGVQTLLGPSFRWGERSICYGSDERSDTNYSALTHRKSAEILQRVEHNGRLHMLDRVVR